MTWTRAERESLSALIKGAVVEANIPIKEMLNELHQTVHGPKDDPKIGLASRTTRVENFQKTILYIFTILTAIGATVTFLVLIFRSFPHTFF